MLIICGKKKKKVKCNICPAMQKIEKIKRAPPVPVTKWVVKGSGNLLNIN